jgi:esterase FrsA
VFHGGNVHYGFQEKWLVPAFTTGGATYLFGAGSLLEARGAAMGTQTMEEFLAAVPRLSLLDSGLLDRPSAPNPRHQRQARRPGAGRGHLPLDGAR